MEIWIAVAVLLILAVAMGLPRLKAGKGTGTYKARQLMTDNEAEFFGRLVVALPEHYVFPQVAMTALIQAASISQKKAHGDRLRIAQQRVDYVICDRRCAVVAVVELDDRTHSPDRDKLRDARLEQGGIRTIRFQSKAKPNTDALRAAILPRSAVAPVSAPDTVGA